VYTMSSITSQTSKGPIGNRTIDLVHDTSIIYDFCADFMANLRKLKVNVTRAYYLSASTMLQDKWNQ
jgi:hypothetical protein